MVTRLIARVKKWWSAAPVATAVLALAVVAALFFASRSVVFWITHPPGFEREQPVAAWMTPRYVSRSWRVPREVIREALKLTEPPAGGPVSLARIAEERGISVDQLVADLEAAIAAYRAEQRGLSAGADP